MGKTWLSAAVAAVIAASMALPAGASSTTREVRQEYRGPGHIEIGQGRFFLGPLTVGSEQVAGGVRFEPRAGERFVAFEIVDDSGAAVSGVVRQKVGDETRLLGRFCGATERPLHIASGKAITVHQGAAACGGNTTGATTGEVVATFST